jgi:CheY-like chemotaxis protein
MPAAPLVLVEDNPDDVLLMRRAFKKLHLVNPLQVLEDGECAIRWLDEAMRGTEGTTRFPPALILLDLKLPQTSGLDVLAWIRRQPAFGRCPTVVLTASREAPDVQRAYELGANSYLIKPVALPAFTELVTSLDLNWEILPNPVPSA